MDFSIYDSTYYETGKLSGKSLYENYRWLPDLTRPMVKRIIEVCGIDKDDTVLDFGCSKGFVVRAFRELGYRASGIDASKWAVENCDESVKDFVTWGTSVQEDYDFVICKDVLEHIPDPDLEHTITNLISHARKGVFVVVPLSPTPGAPYVVPEYEMDVTHAIREPLGGWVHRLTRPGVCVSACYRVPGVKDNYYTPGFEQANGFLWTVKINEEE